MATSTDPLPPSSSSQAAASPVAGSAPEAGGDPFARLYRMSKTAGAGSNDYQAVNTIAVVAVFAGLASALALFSPVLLLVPLFALVCGVVGWRQVVSSNGTQIGKSWAAVGIVLALAFASYVVVGQASKARKFSASKAEISRIFSALESTAKAGDLKATYALFGPGFKERVKYEDFEQYLKNIETAPSGGKLSQVSWNERLEAIDNAEVDIARAVLVLTFERGVQPVPVDVTLVRRKSIPGEGEAAPTPSGANEPWVIEGMPPLFEGIGKKDGPPGRQ